MAKIIIAASPHTDSIIEKLPGETRTEKVVKLVASLTRMKAYMTIVRPHFLAAIGAAEEEADLAEDEDGIILEAIDDLESIINP